MGENITYMGYVFLSSQCHERISSDNAWTYAWIEHVNNIGGSTKCQASQDSPSHLCLSCSLKKKKIRDELLIFFPKSKMSMCAEGI